MAKLISYQICSGIENMQIDERLLDEAISSQYDEPLLRFYGWETPTLTLGRNQKKTEINIDYCRENQIPIIKRITGGRAVLHHMELTYSFISPVGFIKNGGSVILSYKEISEALIIAFEQMGIELSYIENKKIDVKNQYCMAISSGADLSCRGKKFIGSAQFRKNGYVLQHGSILFDVDDEMAKNIFNQTMPNQNVITLKSINQGLLQDVELLCMQIKQGFEKKFNIRF